MKTKTDKQLIHEAIWEQVVEIEDIDDTYMVLEMAVQNKIITAGRAQKLFDKKYPKELTADMKQELEKAQAIKHPEVENAIAARKKVLDDMGMVEVPSEDGTGFRLVKKEEANVDQ